MNELSWADYQLLRELVEKMPYQHPQKLQLLHKIRREQLKLLGRPQEQGNQEPG